MPRLYNNAWLINFVQLNGITRSVFLEVLLKTIRTGIVNTDMKFSHKMTLYLIYLPQTTVP